MTTVIYDSKTGKSTIIQIPDEPTQDDEYVQEVSDSDKNQNDTDNEQIL